jgi:hypothetical protein
MMMSSNRPYRVCRTSIDRGGGSEHGGLSRNRIGYFADIIMLMVGSLLSEGVFFFFPSFSPLYHAHLALFLRVLFYFISTFLFTEDSGGGEDLLRRVLSYIPGCVSYFALLACVHNSSTYM